MNKSTLSTLLLTFLTTVLFSVSATAETIMRIASWLPPTHVQNSYVIPTWGKWIEEATEGRVKIQIEYGMGHPKAIFDLVEDGVVDAGWSFHGYVPGRFRLTQIVEQPLLGVGAEAASVAHWRIHEKYLKKADEHVGLELVALFTHGPGQIQLKEPINSLTDLKGKKIRVGGGVQGVLAHKLELTPIGAPAPKVYEMAQQGVIDGVFMPIAEQKTLRLSEVMPTVVTLPGGIYLGSFSMFINPDFLDSLSKKDRQAILSVSGEQLSALAGKSWGLGDTEGYEAAKAAGNTLIEVGLEDTMYKEFKSLAEGMGDDWIESVKDIDVDAKAALKELRSVAREYENNK